MKWTLVGGPASGRVLDEFAAREFIHSEHIGPFQWEEHVYKPMPMMVSDRQEADGAVYERVGTLIHESLTPKTALEFMLNKLTEAIDGST